MIGVQIHGKYDVTRFHAPNNRENVRVNIQEFMGQINDHAYTEPNVRKISNIPSNITINWGTPPNVSCTVTIQSPEANVIEHQPTRYFAD